MTEKERNIVSQCFAELSSVIGQWLNHVKPDDFQLPPQIEGCSRCNPTWHIEKAEKALSRVERKLRELL